MHSNTSRGAWRAWVGATALAGLLPVLAMGQSYPAKPVRMVSMATAFADSITRLMAQKMQDSMGQPVIVDPNPASGGGIAAALVTKAAPDGYTLFVTYPDPVVLRHLMVKSVPYDSARDFTPVSMMLEAQIVFAISPSLSADNVSQLVAYAKANPGKVSYGTNGIGSSFQMAAEGLALHSGINLVHVPYKSSPDALAALLRGDIQMIVAALGTSLPLHKSGKLRIIGTVNDTRNAGMPEMLSTREVVPGFSSPPYWTGVLGPAGMPEAITQRLYKEIAQAMQSQDIRTRLADAGFSVVANTPEQFRARIMNELASSAKIAKAAGIVPE